MDGEIARDSPKRLVLGFGGNGILSEITLLALGIKPLVPVWPTGHLSGPGCSLCWSMLGSTSMRLVESALLFFVFRLIL